MTYGLLDGEYNDFNVIDTLYDPATFVSTDVLRDLTATPFGGSGDNGKSNTFDIGLIHDQTLSDGTSVTSQVSLNKQDNVWGTLEHVPGSNAPGYTLCLLYTSPSPRDQRGSRMPSSA